MQPTQAGQRAFDGKPVAGTTVGKLNPDTNYVNQLFWSFDDSQGLGIPTGTNIPAIFCVEQPVGSSDHCENAPSGQVWFSLIQGTPFLASATFSVTEGSTYQWVSTLSNPGYFSWPDSNQPALFGAKKQFEVSLPIVQRN